MIEPGNTGDLLGYQHHGQFVCARCWSKFVLGALRFVAQATADLTALVPTLQKRLVMIAESTAIYGGEHRCGECNESVPPAPPDPSRPLYNKEYFVCYPCYRKMGHDLDPYVRTTFTVEHRVVCDACRNQAVSAVVVYKKGSDDHIIQTNNVPLPIVHGGHDDAEAWM